MNTSSSTVGRRYLPRGWGDFGRQLAIWFGFLLVYQIARGLADRDPAQAFAQRPLGHPLRARVDDRSTS